MSAKAVRAYIYGLATLGVVILGEWLYLFGSFFSWTALGIAVVLTMACALSRRFPIDFSRGTIDITDVAVFVALLTLGPAWALLVALPGVFYRDRLRFLFVAACDVIVIFSAGCVLSFFSLPLLTVGGVDSFAVYGAAIAGVVFYSLDAIINSILMRLKYGISIAENLNASFLQVIPSNILTILAALGTAYVMVAFGPAAALVLFSGAAAALVSLHLIHKHQRENEELKAENARLLSSGVGFAAGIVEGLGEKDGYTARLAAASSVFARDVAGEFGLSSERTDKLKIAALLQDVGLVSVPDEIFISAPERLNPVGRMQLERHTIQSEKILSGAAGFEEAAKWVRWHHERMDGTGHPDRLKGQWIPLESRILAVSEIYSSMVLDGPHGPALSPQEARMELTGLSEKSLDAEVVKALLRVLDREDANYATAADDRFTFAVPARTGEDGPVSLRIV